jgi:hypothetical protein
MFYTANFDNQTASLGQQFVYDLLANTNLLDAVGIFLYTWVFLDVVIPEL